MLTQRMVARLFAAAFLIMPVAETSGRVRDSTSGTFFQGLRASDWNSIRDVYEGNSRAAFAVAGGYRARNFGQQWVTQFDGRGFMVEPENGQWRWGLQLESYGRVGQEQAVRGRALLTTDHERVSYGWERGLSEWWVNDKRGLEHGFTLRARPAGDGGSLNLRLKVRGGLHPQVRAGGRSLNFVDDAGRVVVTYGGLTVRDADGRALGARMEATRAEVWLHLDERGARYPLTIDPIAQQAYLKASNTRADAGFGQQVSISGDTVVVGAPLESSNATGVNGNQNDTSAAYAGAAYVFVRTGGVWTQQAYLKASNTIAGGNFGEWVAVSGDTVVVSAPRMETCYVFVRNAGVWTQQSLLKASNSEQGDTFGRSVAISGDTVVVGAPGEASSATGIDGNQNDNSAIGAGAAYVFVRNAGVWTQQAYLKTSNTEALDFFGACVSISGDVVVAGAQGEDSSATGVNGNQSDNSAFDSGAAYVFVRNAGVWSQQAYLKASNTDASDEFGFGVAVAGDTVVVGAEKESSNATGVNGNQTDNSATNAGAAYVFVRNAGVWSQQAYLKASNTHGGDIFGSSLAVAGDAVVVGAVGEHRNAKGVNGNQSDTSAPDAGATYVFVRTSGVWTQQAYLKASNTTAGGNFGYSVSISGDTVVVGAPLEAGTK